jgi:N-acetyltransferase 10
LVGISHIRREGPVQDDSKNLPEILCTIQVQFHSPLSFFVVGRGFVAENLLFFFIFTMQVSLEGKISKESVINSLNRGQNPAGDLIPWTLSQQV